MTRLSVLLPVVLLAGCASGPDYARPDSAAAPAFVRVPEAARPAAPAARWWEGLGDPQLDALVSRALADAPAIDAAEARVRQARAGLASARAGLLPALSASATYIYADLPNGALGGTMGNIDLTNLGFDAQWEADLWGGKRRAIERAAADAGAAEAMLADLHVSLSAEVARSYVALRARQASAALLEARAKQEARLVAVMERRLSGGSGTRQELVQASQQRTRTAAEQAAMPGRRRVRWMPRSAPRRRSRCPRQRFRSAIPPHCSSAGPMSWPPSAGWPRQARGSAWRRPTAFPSYR